MRKNFRTYTLAVEFYKRSKTLPLPQHLKEQLNRASSSIALNLAEGSVKLSKKDQRRFFNIAFGSLRECQAILDLSSQHNLDEIILLADILAAHLYKLIQATSKAA